MVRQLDQEEAERQAELTAALTKMQNHERKTLNVNIDEAWEEHRKESEPFRFQFRGEEFEVASAMPAKFGVFYMEHCLTEVKVEGARQLAFEIPEDLYFRFLDLMFGDALSAAIKASDVSFTFVNTELVHPLMRAWGLMMVDDSLNTKETVSSTEKKSLTVES